MLQNDLFSLALGLPEPWLVSDVRKSSPNPVVTRLAVSRRTGGWF